jgi:hypothetical protein
MHRHEYTFTKRFLKQSVATMIVDEIHEQGGFFVERIDKVGPYRKGVKCRVIPRKRAQEKTSQALREGKFSKEREMNIRKLLQEKRRADKITAQQAVSVTPPPPKKERVWSQRSKAKKQQETHKKQQESQKTTANRKPRKAFKAKKSPKNTRSQKTMAKGRPQETLKAKKSPKTESPQRMPKGKSLAVLKKMTKMQIKTYQKNKPLKSETRPHDSEKLASDEVARAPVSDDEVSSWSESSDHRHQSTPMTSSCSRLPKTRSSQVSPDLDHTVSQVKDEEESVDISCLFCNTEGPVFCPCRDHKDLSPVIGSAILVPVITSPITSTTNTPPRRVSDISLHRLETAALPPKMDPWDRIVLFGWDTFP